MQAACESAFLASIGSFSSTYQWPLCRLFRGVFYNKCFLPDKQHENPNVTTCNGAILPQLPVAAHSIMRWSVRQPGQIVLKPRLPK